MAMTHDVFRSVFVHHLSSQAKIKHRISLLLCSEVMISPGKEQSLVAPSMSIQASLK